MEPHRGTHTEREVSEGNGKAKTREKTVSYTVFECQECSAVALGVRGDGANLTCHDEPMREADAQYDTDPMSTEQVSPGVAVDIYDYAFRRGTVSVTGTAERLGYDPEVVWGNLRALVEAGFLEKREPKLEGGSSVTVYEPRRVD